MSSDELALLAAIDARPADDLPRLVYADWLDDHGRAVRAEFIRLQCEIARHEADRTAPAGHGRAWERQHDLLTHHRAELLGSLSAMPKSVVVEFERGFPAEVTVSVAEFLTHGAALVAARPRPKVAVVGVAANAPGFFRSPHLRCVTRVSAGVTGDVPEPEQWPPDDRVDTAADRLDRLEELDLSGCHLGIWGVHVYAGVNSKLPSLVELNLTNNDLDDVAVTRLLEADLPQRLILDKNPITDQGAFELANELGPSRVEHLSLRGTQITRLGHIALLEKFPGGRKKVDLF